MRILLMFSQKIYNLPRTVHFVGLAEDYVVVRSGIKPVRTLTLYELMWQCKYTVCGNHLFLSDAFTPWTANPPTHNSCGNQVAR